MTTALAEPLAGTQSTALTTINSARDLLKQAEAQLALALPRHIPVSYMIRVVLTVVQRTPKLLECDKLSMLGAVFQCAQLGLIPDGVLGQAYLVPFRNTQKNRMEVQMIPGYRGLVELVRRSGELSTIDADVVYEKDKFTYTRGTEAHLEHVPTDEASPGKLVAAYAIARLKDGGYQIKVMKVREIEAIRKRSKAANNGPWVTDFEWMAKKTVIKQLCKLLPVSTETQRAMALDDRAELELPQDLGMLVSETETPTPVEEPLEGEIAVPMPERTSTQPQQAKPAAPTTVAEAFLPPGADRITMAARKASTSQPGKHYWTFETARKVSGYTWDENLGLGLETAAASGMHVTLQTEPDQQQKLRLVGLQPFPTEREPGSDD